MPADLPLVTVAMPAFNHECYVRHALDCVLDSGLPQVEIVVADDASTDGTARVIRAWADENRGQLASFVFIERKRNVGLCGSLNEIVSAAKGELIHIIASDDYYLPGGLATKTRAMLENPSWISSFCDAQAIGLDGELYVPSILGSSRRMSRERLTSELITEELLYHWDIVPSLQTWRRDAYKAHGGEFAYDPTVFCQDFDGAWWALGHGGIGFIPQVCQAYRCRSWPQSSDRNHNRELRDMAFVMEKNARYFNPRIAAAMRNYAGMLLAAATGDLVLSDACGRAHALSADDFIRRAATGEAAPEAVPDAKQLLLDDLAICRSEVARLRTALAEAKSRISAQSISAKENAALIKSLRQQLRHHATNPKRALELWWRGFSNDGG